jgi:gluconolactonase
MPDGTLLLVELERRTLTRVTPDGAQTIVARFAGGPNGAAIGPDGKCYVCNNGGSAWIEDANGLRPTLQPHDYVGGRIERVDLATGEVETLYTESDKAPLRGPNDLVFDGEGGFYFTDLGKARPRERDLGSVLYARADGSGVREIVRGMLTPNGIGLAPDGKRLYVAETLTARLWAFDLEAPGRIRRAATAWAAPGGGQLVAGVGGYQLFDSLAVDSAGNILVATLINGGITVISPDGQSVRHLPMPDPFATNLCFGGPELKTAYVTLSAFGRVVAFDWERPGLPLHRRG